MRALRLLVIPLILFFLLTVGSALQESLTYDEPLHLKEGINALVHHTFAIDPLNPPLVRELAALPVVLGAQKIVHSSIPSLQMLPARLVIVVLSVALLISMFFTAKRYVGAHAALLSAILFAFEPNILAHSHYVTLDMGFTLFFFMAYMAFLRLLDGYPRMNDFLQFGIFLGLGMAAKISMSIFLGLTTVLIFFTASVRRVTAYYWSSLLAAGVVAFVVVWATYSFTTAVVIAQRDDVNRVSSKLTKFAEEKHVPLLKELLWFGQNQKIPLGQYLALAKNTAIYTRQPKPVFYFGRHYDRAKWYFLPVNLFLKLPLPLTVLFFVGTVAGLLHTERRQITLLFLAPIIAILGFSSVSGISPWTRYVLPIFPFIFILAGSSILSFTHRWSRILLAIVLIWYMGGTLVQYPHFLSYANELAGKPEDRYKIFYDANIEWGEGLYDVGKFVQTHKDKAIYFSYFGTDDGAYYGVPSDTPYETYKVVGICAFHKVNDGTDGTITLINASNWQYCGYYKKEEYKENKIQEVYKRSLLVF